MKALILNSGVGNRMGELTKTKNKCMAEIGKDTTIIDWQLRLLLKVGIKDVVITTGPFKEDLMEYVEKRYPDMHFIFRENQIYDKTNYIYSIHMAEDVLHDDIIMMHGDLVFEESVLLDILNSKSSAMVIDTTLSLPEKDFKAVVSEGKIVKVGIEFFEQAFAAQPLYKLTREDWAKWLDNIRLFCEAGNRGVYAENAMNEISDNMDIRPLNVNGRICAEVDNLEDLEIVRKAMSKYFQ